jgi:predicted peroxiredoxin
MSTKTPPGYERHERAVDRDELVTRERDVGAARRLVLVLWAADPSQPARTAAPFVYALAARALEIEVEMHFTATSVQWLFEGVAERAHTDQARSKTVLDFIREVRTAGVKLFACAMALHEHRHGEALIAECDGVAGAATVIDATVAADTRTIVF